MILFHCPIEKNEHVHSWISRVHMLSGNRVFKHTANFIGVKDSCLKPFSHSHTAKDVITLLTNTYHQPEAYFFDDNTTFPLWSLTFSGDVYREWRVKNNCVMPKCFHLGKFAIKSCWQYCETCVMEDTALLGHSVWHTQHQLPSITHCYKHKTLLMFNNPKLRDLRACTLPQEYKFEKCIYNNEALLLKWSRFVNDMFLRLKNDKNLGHILQQRIRRYLNVHHEMKGSKSNLVFTPLERNFQEEVPEDLLKHLFKFNMVDFQCSTNVLKSTLGWERPIWPKHPILWLIILYWLKDKISLES